MQLCCFKLSDIIFISYIVWNYNRNLNVRNLIEPTFNNDTTMIHMSSNACARAHLLAPLTSVRSCVGIQPVAPRATHTGFLPRPNFTASSERGDTKEDFHKNIWRVLLVRVGCSLWGDVFSVRRLRCQKDAGGKCLSTERTRFVRKRWSSCPSFALRGRCKTKTVWISFIISVILPGRGIRTQVGDPRAYSHETVNTVCFFSHRTVNQYRWIDSMKSKSRYFRI